jgi:hypothetical protein
MHGSCHFYDRINDDDDDDGNNNDYDYYVDYNDDDTINDTHTNTGNSLLNL